MAARLLLLLVLQPLKCLCCVFFKSPQMFWIVLSVNYLKPIIGRGFASYMIKCFLIYFFISQVKLTTWESLQSWVAKDYLKCESNESNVYTVGITMKNELVIHIYRLHTKSIFLVIFRLPWRKTFSDWQLQYNVFIIRNLTSDNLLLCNISSVWCHIGTKPFG